MTDTSRNYRRGKVRDAVEAWLSEASEGMEFHLNDITADLGMELSSVSGALRTMARNGEGVTVTARRGWYRKDDTPARVPLVPVAVPVREPAPVTVQAAAPAHVPDGWQDRELKSGDLMEVVAVFKSGRVLLRAANEKLYTAEEAEL